MTELYKNIRAAMEKEAAKQYPNEACGLLYKKGRKVAFAPCRNISADTRRSFTLDPLDFARVRALGEIVAFWHSHPDEEIAIPSPTDSASCDRTGLPWYITALREEDGKFIFAGPCHVSPREGEPAYEGRPYIWGVHDCFTIMADFYRREYGIAFDWFPPEYPAVQNWWNQGHNLLEDHFGKLGFERLVDQPPRRGDVFLISVGSPVASHVAVYLGHGRILHHPEGRASKVDVFGGFYEKHAIFHLRHKEVPHAD